MRLRAVRSFFFPMEGVIFYLFLLSCSGSENPSFIPAGTPTGGGGAPIAYTASYSISVTLVGSGSVTSDLAGIQCGSVCSASFNGGVSVTLKATPQMGSTFSGWSGDCKGTTVTCTLTLDGNKKVTATFISGNALNITSVDGGRAHTCALVFRSAVACWGNNQYGQLGNGTNASSSTPLFINGIPPSVDQVTAGDDHTCLLVSQGTIQCWGLNNDGQLGNGTSNNSNVPVPVAGINYPVGVTAGGNHTCALRADGMVLCWGLNSFGQLGDGTNNNRLSPVLVFGLTPSASSTVTGISAGANHTCSLISDGSVICWGNNQYGQLGDGTTSSSSNKPVLVSGLTKGVAVSAGNNHVCVLISDGTVKCWGLNSSGQLGNTSAGLFSNRPVSVANLSQVTAISAGGDHTCALISDGTIQCWGANSSGQLGNGTPSSYQTTPVTVTGLNNAVYVGAGVNHTCAILSDQTVDCWGDNSNGQLGTGTYISSPNPKTVSGL